MGLEYKATSTSSDAELIGVDDQTGVVEAIVSVTGVRDEDRDIIEPGAYAQTLARRRPKGIFHHDWRRWVARTEHIEELLPGDGRLPKQTKDGHPWPVEAGGLYVRTRFNLKTDEGRNAYENVKFFSETGECHWSIGYRIPAGMSRRDKTSGTRHIKEVDLFEYSPVLFGAAGSFSGTLSVKNDSAAGPDETDPDRTEPAGADRDQPEPAGADPDQPEPAGADPDQPAPAETVPAVEQPEATPPGQETPTVAPVGEPAPGEAEDEPGEGDEEGGKDDEPEETGNLSELHDEARRLIEAEADDYDEDAPEERAEDPDAGEQPPEAAGEVEAKAGVPGVMDTPSDAAAFQKLKRWYVRGEGAAQIRWGQPGDFDRCVRIAGKHMDPSRAKGFCANRHKEATGSWPGREGGRGRKEADAEVVESATYPYLPGSAEELRCRLAGAAVKTLGLGEGERVEVVATWPERVVVAAFDAAGGCKAYEIDYEAKEESLELGEPQAVQLTVFDALAEADALAADEEAEGAALSALPGAVEEAKALAVAAALEHKAGRVLSAANAKRLQIAVESLVEVLRVAGVELNVEPPPSPVQPEGDTDTTAPSARAQAPVLPGKTLLDPALHAKAWGIIAAAHSRA